MKTNMIEFIRQQIEAEKNRSAWDKGVNSYEHDILDVVTIRACYSGKDPETRSDFIDYMLNGAQDYRSNAGLYDHWRVASNGGSYEIYDCDIAQRLCNPSELRKTKDGSKRPNKWETWLDVQARALFHAGNRLLSYYQEYCKL